MNRKQAKREREKQKFSPEELLERKRIRRLIRAGKMPRYHFVRDKNGALELASRPKAWMLLMDKRTGKQVESPRFGLSLRMVSTLETLAGKRK